jgi:acetyltransferase-like isoleucine patch superfamily enzyme
MKSIYNRILNSFFGILVPFFKRIEPLARRAQLKEDLTKFKKCGAVVLFGYPYRLGGPEHISIGTRFKALYNLRLEAIDYRDGVRFSPEIIIGDNVSCGSDFHIGAINKVVIGNNVLLASRIYISDHSHGEITKDELAIAPNKRLLFSKGAVIIEDNVWIGEGVAILPNVTIGRNSIIGANAVVTKSFPPFSIIAGNPAKLIRSYDDSVDIKNDFGV